MTVSIRALQDRRRHATGGSSRLPRHHGSGFYGSVLRVMGFLLALSLLRLDAADTLQFSSGQFTVIEGNTATITVTRSGSAVGVVKVDYCAFPSVFDNSSGFPAVSGGNGDYALYTSRIRGKYLGVPFQYDVPASGTLVFNDGEVVKTFTIPTNADGILEGDETLSLILRNVQGSAVAGALRDAQLLIHDADAPQSGVLQFSSPLYHVDEAAGTATVTVSRTGGSTGAVSVRYQTQGVPITYYLDNVTTTPSVAVPAARSGVNYSDVSATLTWADGDAAPKSFTVPIIHTATANVGVQNIGLSLSNASGAVIGTSISADLYVVDSRAANFQVCYRRALNPFPRYLVDGSHVSPRVLGCPMSVTIPAATPVVNGLFMADSLDKRGSWQGNTIVSTICSHYGFAEINYTGEFDAPPESNEPVGMGYVEDTLQLLAFGSSHPEIANAPFMGEGQSSPAMLPVTFCQTMPERALGFVAVTGGHYRNEGGPTVYENDPYEVFYETSAIPEGVKSVPGLFIDGELDTFFDPVWGLTRNYLIETYFTSLRSRGALVSFVVDWNSGHDYLGQKMDITACFFEQIIHARWPTTGRLTPGTSPGQTLTLKPLSESDGWLGEKPLVDRNASSSYLNIAPAALYTGDHATASWLPNEAVARAYRAHSSVVLPISAALPWQTPMQITAPTEFQSVNANLTFTVDPRTLGNISLMEFYDGADKLGQLSAPQVAWTLPATCAGPGIHTISAVATDSSNKKTTTFCAIFVKSVGQPKDPMGLVANPLSSSQIQLAWVDTASNETGFRIERKIGSAGTYAQIATVAANVVGHTDTGLSLGTPYYYRVRATNAAGDSNYSNEANASVAVGAVPVLAVARGGTAIAKAGTDAFGTAMASMPSVLHYTLGNGGIATLHILGNASLGGFNNCTATVLGSPGTVAPGSLGGLDLTVTPSSAGAWSFTMSLASDDALNTPYGWTVSGAAAAWAVPELDISRAGTPILDRENDPVSAASTTGVGLLLSYTLTNNGSATITLPSSATLYSPNNCTAAVTMIPATSLAPSASTTLGVTVTPSSSGPWSFRLSVVSNDADENPYNWLVSGTAGRGPAQELDVTRGTIPVAKGGTDGWSAGNAGTPLRLDYTLTNNGSVNALSLPSGAMLAAMTNCTAVVTTTPATSVAPGAATHLVITATPAAVGKWSFTVSVPNNDANENPYTWAVNGTAIAAPPAAELDIARGGTAIVDGGNDAFGASGAAGTATVISYTLANSGSAVLTISAGAVVSSPVNCTVGIAATPLSLVPAASTTSLAVLVIPSSAGAWSFAVSVASDDANENPYTWTITGTATGSGQSSQVITGFTSFGAHTYGNAPFAISGVSGGGSGNPVTFSSSNTAVAMVSGATITMVGSGSSTISANQAGNASFSAAPTVQQVLTVAKAPLGVTAAAASRAFGASNPTFTGTITGIVNGDPITATYASSATATTAIGIYGPATPEAITPTLVDPSNRLSNYTTTTTKGTLTITGTLAQTIVGFTAFGAHAYGNPPIAIAGVTGGASGNPVTFASSNTAVATVSGTTVTIVGAGTATITASQAGNANYTVANDVPQVLTVAKAPLGVTATAASRAFGASNPTFTGTITGVVNGDPITATYASSATATTAVGTYGPATPEAITPTLVDPGNRLGNYTATTTKGTLTISPAAQTISGFTAFGALAYGNPPFTIPGVTGGASGNPVAFASSNTAVATLSGTTVTLVGAGTATITASQAGDTNHLAAIPVAQVLTVGKAALSVTASNANRVFGTINPTFTGALTGVVANDPITATYASSATATTAIGIYGPATPEAIMPTLVDASGRLVNYAVTRTNGTLTITAVPTGPPTPATPSISNAGSATPTISGSTSPNATVSIIIDGNLTGTVIADASGNWTYTVTPALAAGAHSLTVTATDSFGTSAPSPALALFTAAAPQPPATASVNASHPKCGIGASLSLVLVGFMLHRRLTAR